MSVGFDGTTTTVACLEGHCDVAADPGTSNLTGGQTCELAADFPNCKVRPISGEESQTWLENIPGSIPDLPATEAFTPTLEPTLLPTSTGTPSATITPLPTAAATPSGRSLL